MQVNDQAEHRFQVLSLDGGGLKALFTAAFLAEWEKFTGETVTSTTDLIAGTSAGGIIALALGAGFSASEIVALFRDRGELIFPPDGVPIIGKARQLTGSRYDPAPLEGILDEYFGSRTLGESASRLIIPAYHAESGIHIFKTPHHARFCMDWRERMSTVARATAAAPTFLPPLALEAGFRLIDGGVWCNNPVMVAVTEAIGALKASLGSVAALRISTTTPAVPIDQYPDDSGAIHALKIIDVMMRGQAQSASGGVKQMLGENRFLEVDPIVVPGDYELNRLSQELIGLAKSEFRKSVPKLREKGFLDHRARSFRPLHPHQEQTNGA